MAAWLPSFGGVLPWLDMLAQASRTLLRITWREYIVFPIRRMMARQLARAALWCAADAAVAVARPAVTVADLDTMPMPALVCPLPLPVREVATPSPAPVPMTRPIYSGLTPYALQLGYSPHATTLDRRALARSLGSALMVLEKREMVGDWRLLYAEAVLDALLPVSVVADEALAERVAQQPSMPLSTDWLRQAQQQQRHAEDSGGRGVA